MSKDQVNDSSSRRGRPRDPAIQSKVLAAAVEVYGEFGWSGFTLDAVSSRALVGRPAVYRRWESKEALLVDALREHTPGLTEEDHGSLHADLMAIAENYASVSLGTRGLATLRTMIDRQAAPEVFAAISSAITERRYELIRSALRRASARGEIDVHVHFDAIANMLLGGVLFSVFGDKSEEAPESWRQVLTELVDIIVLSLR
ncbi:TetR/AcrR family transcriptional regulator [Diaminobutyricimonas sp. LJ205]|uniref:TetR/AcrR family transcriptional regulator n=1 Tax=Diaminobutyricimonas sp. LJ205 TaxID=2683590 RepID=UPI0018DFDD6E|nr:TetR/AcrR family transcriptional regulator [Diaminobutyricimonas sp. LJ205]